MPPILHFLEQSVLAVAKEEPDWVFMVSPHAMIDALAGKIWPAVSIFDKGWVTVHAPRPAGERLGVRATVSKTDPLTLTLASVARDEGIE